MSTEQQRAKDRISNKAVPEINEIPFDLVDKSGNKTTRLLANSGASKSIDGQNRWYSFEFKRPVFIYRLVVTESGYPEYKEFQIRCTDINGNIIYNSNKPQSGRVYLEVNQFCNKIEFQPPKQYFSDTKIESVQVFGFDLNDAGRFIQFVRDIESIKDTALSELDKKEAVYEQKIEEAEKAESLAAQARKDVSTLKSQADRQRQAIRQLESQRDDLTTKVTALDTALKSNERDLQILNSELNSRAKQKELIESQIEESKNNLSELKSNIDLFPSELDSFVRQGSRNNRFYF